MHTLVRRPTRVHVRLPPPLPLSLGEIRLPSITRRRILEFNTLCFPFRLVHPGLRLSWNHRSNLPPDVITTTPKTTTKKHNNKIKSLKASFSVVRFLFLGRS